MSCYERIQPLLSKERIWPTLMVLSSSSSLSVLPFAKNTSQPHPNPSVQARKGRAMTVFEVFKPAPHCPIDVRDNGLQASPIRPLGLGSHCILQLCKTPSSRPPHPSLEMVPKKVEASWLGGIYDPRLFCVKSQACSLHPFFYLLQTPLGFRLCLIQKHEVSNAEELPLYVLSEPGVNLSAHRAPIIQPPVLHPSASAGIARVAFGQSSLTNVPHVADAASTF